MKNFYSLNCGKVNICGDPNTYINGYLGHMLNDGYKISFDKEITSDKEWKQKIIEYNTHSKRDNNCCYFDGHLFARRNIKKGEELLSSYGMNYWYTDWWCNTMKTDRKDNGQERDTRLLSTNVNYLNYTRRQYSLEVPLQVKTMHQKLNLKIQTLEENYIARQCRSLVSII